MAECSSLGSLCLPSQWKISSVGSFAFLGKRRLRQDLDYVHKYPMRGNEDESSQWCPLIKKIGNGHKLKHRKLHLNAGNVFGWFFFPSSFEGGQRLNRLPREVAKSSMDIFKA